MELINKNSRIYYGWYIVFAAFFAHFLATGISFYIFNAFMEPLCRVKGWTRTDINIAPMLGWAIGLLCSFTYGTLVMRVGARLLMTLGSLVSAAAFSLMGTVTDIRMFYLFYMLLHIGNGAMAGIVANTAVNNWFIDKRGKAMGMATSGISLSGAVLPITAMIILENAGLQNAFFSVSGLILIFTPVAWIFVRNRPEDHGLLPDGKEKPENGNLNRDSQIDLSLGYEEGITLDLIGENENPSLWTFQRLFTEQAFWKVGISFGIVIMGVMGVMFQLKPQFSSIGFSDRVAMLLMCATALIGTAGKFIWGILCDRFEIRKVASFLLASNGIGLTFVLFQKSTLSIILFIVIFGFAMGGVMSIFPIIVAYLFGRDSFAKVAKYMVVLLSIGSLGYLIMGQSFDHTGSYKWAYIIFIVMDLIAALLIYTVKNPVLNEK